MEHGVSDERLETGLIQLFCGVHAGEESSYLWVALQHSPLVSWSW